MATSGQKLDGLCYIAWNTITVSGQINDASNHVLRLVRDGQEIIPANAPVEVDPTGCPGLYKINLTAAEMEGNTFTLAGISNTINVVIVPVQLNTIQQVVAPIPVPTQRSGGQIWSDEQLSQWATDAIGQIAIEINCIFVRECIPTEEGVSVYTLPSYVRTVRRVTWRGKSVTPVNWDEFTLITPATAFLAPGSSANLETSRGLPLYYAMHPTNPWDIRFYPTPNESFTVAGEPNPYAPQVNSPSCIIDFYREPDTSDSGSDSVISIPAYVLRRIQKAYVGWKAFAAEGKGQDLKASEYYKNRYYFLIESFRLINEGCFIGKRYAIDDGQLTVDNFRYPKPVLPTNYENVRF